MKFYHASPKRFRVGDLVEPRSTDGGTAAVYLTTEPLPHYTIADAAREEGWEVYVVAPIGKVLAGNYSDIITHYPCVIVGRVGNARGLLRNRPRTPLRAGSRERGGVAAVGRILTPRGWIEIVKCRP